MINCVKSIKRLNHNVELKAPSTVKNISITRIIISMICIFILVAVSGCQSKLDKIKNSDIAAVFTSSTKEKSKIVFMDEKGKKAGEKEIKKLGIFDVIKAKDKLFVPVRFGEEILEIDLKTDRIHASRTLEFPFYYNTVGDKRFIIYNSDVFGDIDYLTYELNSEEDKITKRIKGFPQCMTVYDGKAYVFTDMVNENTQLINIINMSNLNLDQSIPIYCPQAGDIKVFDDFLYVTNVHNKELIKISLKDPSNRTVKKLSFENPKFILAVKDNFIVVHEKAISMLDRESMEITKQINTEVSAIKAKIFNNEIYVLSQEHNGTILVYDVKNLSLEKSLELKGDEDMLVQDFEFLK